MKVEDLMTRNVVSCGPGDPLRRAAQIMWDRDCGCVPVVDAYGCVVGIVTDRDACMAAYTTGRRLEDINVAEAMSRNVHLSRPGEALEAAERRMREVQVRRLPVVDAGQRLVGLLSLIDIARYGRNAYGHRCAAVVDEGIAQTLAAVGAPRNEAANARVTSS